MTLKRLSDELLFKHIQSLTDWELLEAFSYCQKSLDGLPGYEFEVLLVAEDNFHGNVEDSRVFLQKMKQIYRHEYFNRKRN